MGKLRFLALCILLVAVLSFGAGASNGLLGGFSASCWKQVIRPDESVDANIVISNASEEALADINVFFWVEDPAGNSRDEGAIYISLGRGETKTIENSVGAGEEGKTGKYTFNAVATYAGEERTASCNFFAEIGIGYYYKTLELLDSEVNALSSIVEEKRANEYAVFEISSELEKIKTSVRDLRTQVIAGEFGRFDVRAKSIYTSIGSVYASSKLLKRQQLPATSIILVVFLGVAIGAIIYLIKRRRVKERIVVREVPRIIKVPRIIRREHVVVKEVPKIVTVEKAVEAGAAERVLKEEEIKSDRQKLRGQLEALENARRAGLVGNDAYTKDKRKLRTALKRGGK